MFEFEIGVRIVLELLAVVATTLWIIDNLFKTK